MSKRVEDGIAAQSFLQVILCQMCIAHGHGDGRMTKHLLQGQDVPASDDEVISESMAKHMLSLGMRKER